MTPIIRLSILAITASAAGAQVTFSDHTENCGIISDYQIPPNGNSLMRFAPGAAAGDFNRDGLQDIFIPTDGSNAPRLYINQGDGTMSEQAAVWGLTEVHHGIGCAVADYNADGYLDIYVTSWGDASFPFRESRSRLYRNNGPDTQGQFTFTEVAFAAGVNLQSASVPDSCSPAWGDIDLDGDLDLAVAGWFGTNRLYRNDGFSAVFNETRFTDITNQLPANMAQVRGFTPRFHDMDGDRYPELLWVADFYTSQYFVNNTDGTFTNMTVPAGVGIDSNGMGQFVADVNNDGLPDWYVSSINETFEDGSGNMLYMNQGNHVYSEESLARGVNDGAWGWGAFAVDLDHDGHLDIVETNDNAAIVADSKIFMNQGDNTYVESAAALGVVHPGNGRGVVSFDLENDGDRDILITRHGDNASIFRNELTGPDTHWLRVALDTAMVPSIAPDGIGARITVTAGDRTLYRWIEGGSNFLSQDEMVAHFGLADADTIDELRVDWPDGSQSVLTDIPADQTLVVVAGETVEPCIADTAEPFGTLNFNDVVVFLIAFSEGDPGADIAEPIGTLDFSDVLAFLVAFSEGCP